MGFGIGLVVGALIGVILASLLAANKIAQIGAIEDKIDAYKESVDKAVNLVYEVAEQNKKLAQEKKEREFMDKMIKGEPAPDAWKAL